MRVKQFFVGGRHRRIFWCPDPQCTSCRNQRRNHFDPRRIHPKRKLWKARTFSLFAAKPWWIHRSARSSPFFSTHLGWWVDRYNNSKELTVKNEWERAYWIRWTSLPNLGSRLRSERESTNEPAVLWPPTSSRLSMARSPSTRAACAHKPSVPTTG